MSRVWQTWRSIGRQVRHTRRNVWFWSTGGATNIRMWLSRVDIKEAAWNTRYQINCLVALSLFWFHQRLDFVWKCDWLWLFKVATGRDHFRTYLGDASQLTFQLVREEDGCVLGHATSSPGMLERVVDYGGMQDMVRITSNSGYRNQPSLRLKYSKTSI